MYYDINVYNTVKGREINVTDVVVSKSQFRRRIQNFHFNKQAASSRTKIQNDCMDEEDRRVRGDVPGVHERTQ
jgi:hypothetical protein